MGRTLDEKLAGLPKERRAKIDAETAMLIAEEQALRDLRKDLNIRQRDIAEALGMDQSEVSRAERRADMLVSTLRSYIAAMGGNLELVARFPDRPAVTIAHIGDLRRDDEETATSP